MSNQNENDIIRLSNQGVEYHQRNDIGKAIEFFKEAYDLARKINNEKTERTCAFNLGAAYIANEKPSEALNYLHKADLPEGQKDERSNGDLYLNMGLCHEMLKKEDEAVKNFKKANAEYKKYGRDKTELRIQCLEKCFKIYKQRGDFLEAANICQSMADAFDDEDVLRKAEKLCEKATHLRFATFANKTEKAMEAAKECKEVLINIRPKGDDCIFAGKIQNDLGLLFTQLLKYDDATDCFNEAWKLICNRQEGNHLLVAVVLQNRGAAHNLIKKYQKAIEYHEDAAKKFAEIQERNMQGQCFANLAFAHTELRNFRDAEIAYHHALQAAKDTRDDRMKWQMLEALGDVSFQLGNMKESGDHYIEALKAVGDNKAESARIKMKMEKAIRATGSKQTAILSRGQSVMPYFGSYH